MSFEKPNDAQEKIHEPTGWWAKTLFCLGNGVVEAYKAKKTNEQGSGAVEVTLQKAASTKKAIEEFDPEDVIAKKIEGRVKKIADWLLEDTSEAKKE